MEQQQQAPATTVRDEAGKFVALDKADMRTYKQVRDAGKEAVEEADVEAKPEITGTEPQKEFKEKRDEQIHGKSAEKRISKLVKQREEARQEAARNKQEAETLKARYEPPTTPQPNEGRERLVQEKFARHSAKVNEEIPDIEELRKAGAHTTVPLPAHVTEHILDSENGHQIAAHLARNPKLVEELLALQPWEAHLKLEKISGRLERDKEMETVKETVEEAVKEGFKSRAAAPINPIGGGSTKSTVPLDRMPMSDYKRARNAGRIR